MASSSRTKLVIELLQPVLRSASSQATRPRWQGACVNGLRSKRSRPHVSQASSFTLDLSRIQSFHSSPSDRAIRLADIGSKATTHPGRAFISLSGRDTFKLLQGLVTNDVRRLEEQYKRLREGKEEVDGENAFYCALLNPQGRMIAPVFVYPHPDPPDTTYPHVILDCHADNLQGLLDFIKRFKLRSKVKIEAVDPDAERWAVWALWGDAGEVISQQEAAAQAGSIGARHQTLQDPRTPHMGVRILSKESEAKVADGASTFSATESEPELYTLHRLIQGVPEGPVELPENHSLPLEANIELMHGVDFRKGCYVGQELTARTHHTGVVRKRIMPVKIAAKDGESSLPEVGSDVRAPPSGAAGGSRRAKSAGKLLSAVRDPHGNGFIGLASLRLGMIPLPAEGSEPAASLLIQGGEEGQEAAPWSVEAVWPEWWPREIKGEYVDTNTGEPAKDANE